jgi:ATP-binding cassette, subfamily B, multidrug efflux pump
MRHLRRLLPYFSRYRSAYLGGLALVVAATVLGILVPFVVKAAVALLDRHPPKAALLKFAGAIAALAVGRAVLLSVGRFVLLRAARRIEAEMRDAMYARLETLSARWFDTHPTGEITSRIINDIEGVRVTIGFGLMALASTGLLLTATIVALFAIQPVLAAFCLIPLALIGAVMVYTGARMHTLSLAVQDQLGTLSTRAQENFSGTRVVRAFAQEEREIDRFRGASREYLERSLRLARLRAFWWGATLILIEGGLLVTLYLGGRDMIGGNFDKGDLAFFLINQLTLVWPMIAIGWVVGVIQRGVACMGRLAEILDAAPDVDDAKAVAGPPPDGAIEARNLTFAYSPDREPALKDVSFRVEAGERVALVGKTGAGKTTLLNLLLRLYPVPDGALFVGGRDVNTIPLRDLRAAVGAVPQDLFLFSAPLRENIAFGSTSGAASDEEIRRAAEISRLSADLEKFPGGLDQVIGERGVTLSGGQKQRAALARAIARDARILALDDALSSVDADTEEEIRGRLRAFAQGRTTLIVTHRLSMVVDADRILVLDGGRLVEQGRHDALGAAGGVYAALWEGQKLAEALAGA